MIRISGKDFGGVDFLRNIGLVVFVRAFAAASIFLFNYVVAKWLTVVDSGYFFWTFSGLVIAVQIAVMGFHDVAMKYVARYSGNEDWGRTWEVSIKILSWVTVALFIVAALSFSLAEAFADRFFSGTSDVASIIMVMAPSIIFSGISHVVSFQLQGIGRPLKAIFSLSIGQYLTFFCIFFAFDIQDAVSAGAAYTFSTLLNMIIALWWWRKAIPNVKRTSIDTGELWRMALPMWVIAVMAVFVNWGGQFVSALWVDAEDIAHYAVALRAVALINFVLIAMNFIVAPRIARLHAANDEQELQNFIFITVRALYLLAAPAVLLIFFFSSEIMSLFGSNFSNSGDILLILTAGQIINVMTGPVGYLLTMTGHERHMRNMYIFSGFFCIILTYILTSHMGIRGTAWATSLSILVQNLGAAYLVKRKLGISISPFRKIIKKS